MYNAGKIIVGMVVFLVLITFPIWYKAGKAYSPAKLELDTPAIRQLKEKVCVEPTPFMRAKHMELIDEWRYQVVRMGRSIYLASNGKQWNMSLTNTCLNCHANKEKFCDRCHNQTGVDPTCWSCHVIPKETES